MALMNVGAGALASPPSLWNGLDDFLHLVDVFPCEDVEPAARVLVIEEFIEYSISYVVHFYIVTEIGGLSGMLYL